MSKVLCWLGVAGSARRHRVGWLAAAHNTFYDKSFLPGEYNHTLSNHKAHIDKEAS